jgi:hypothetical protein
MFAVNIWTENVTEISNEFLSLTHVLNLKKLKIQVSIGYLTQKNYSQVIRISTLNEPTHNR